MRRITMQDVSEAWGLDPLERDRRAADLLAAFRAVDAIDDELRDRAGLAIRGGSVWRDELPAGRWTVGELAAARIVLLQQQADSRTVDAIEFAIGKVEVPCA